MGGQLPYKSAYGLAQASFPSEERLLQDACAKKPSIWAVSAPETAQMEGFSRQSLPQGLPKLCRWFFVGESQPKALPKIRSLIRKDCCRMRAPKNPRSGPYRRPKRPRWRVFRAKACPKACPSFVDGFLSAKVSLKPCPRFVPL